jgi:hypothetical protein
MAACSMATCTRALELAISTRHGDRHTIGTMTQDSNPTPTARGIGVQLAVGGVLGFAASSFVGPAIIGWWYEPPIKDAFSCASSVRAALSQFVTMQLICAAVGGAAATLTVFLVRRALRNRASQTQPTRGA